LLGDILKPIIANLTAPILQFGDLASRLSDGRGVRRNLRFRLRFRSLEGQDFRLSRQAPCQEVIGIFYLFAEKEQLLA
jgi:hypothetical protein